MNDLKTKSPKGKVGMWILVVAIFGSLVLLVAYFAQSDTTSDNTADTPIDSKNFDTQADLDKMDERAISESEFYDTIPFYPEVTGNPIVKSNFDFEVSLTSDKYVYFRGLQLPYLWLDIKNLGSVDDKYNIRLKSAVPEGWDSVPEFAGHTWLEPGQQDGFKLTYKQIYAGLNQEEVESTFTYEVTSEQSSQSLEFDVTMVVYPELSSTMGAPGSAPEAEQGKRPCDIEGTVKDSQTGGSIEGAEVSLWLGNKVRLMPYDMVRITGSNGVFELPCWSVAAINEHYSPYFEVEGYRLLVQKSGYETYVYNDYLNPDNEQMRSVDIELTPLVWASEYDLVWEKGLAHPGVWEIAPTDNWDRFAVAMGKHPDPNDAQYMPSVVSFLDDSGSVLWQKDLADESWAVDVAGDGTYVACAIEDGDGGHYLWDAQGNEIWKNTPVHGGLEIVFSPDNKQIGSGPSAAADGFVLYDTQSGDELWTSTAGSRGARAVTFSEDGQYVFAAPILHKFDLEGNLQWRRFISYVPYVIRLSSDNNYVMVADKGDVVSMFDFDGNLLWRKEHFLITYADMSEDASITAVLTSYGELFAYNAEGELLWYRLVPGTTTEQCVYCSGAGHNGVDVTSDGEYIAVGSGNYHTVLYDREGNIVWQHEGDAELDMSVHPLRRSVMAVRISDDGSKIISGYGTSDPRVLFFERSEE